MASLTLQDLQVYLHFCTSIIQVVRRTKNHSIDLQAPFTFFNVLDNHNTIQQFLTHTSIFFVQCQFKYSVSLLRAQLRDIDQTEVLKYSVIFNDLMIQRKYITITPEKALTTPFVFTQIPCFRGRKTVIILKFLIRGIDLFYSHPWYPCYIYSRTSKATSITSFQTRTTDKNKKQDTSSKLSPKDVDIEANAAAKLLDCCI